MHIDGGTHQAFPATIVCMDAVLDTAAIPGSEQDQECWQCPDQLLIELLLLLLQSLLLPLVLLLD
jgi:hypothetical protein